MSWSDKGLRPCPSYTSIGNLDNIKTRQLEADGSIRHPRSGSGSGSGPGSESGLGTSGTGSRNMLLARGRLPALYHGTWPMERETWNQNQNGNGSEVLASVMSFTSTSNGMQSEDDADNPELTDDNENLAEKYDVKKDMIFNLLGMLMNDNTGQQDTSMTLLSLSNSADNCLLMRESGCLSLLVRLIHAPDKNLSVRLSATRALYNIICATEDKTLNHQELRILTLLERIREYSQSASKSPQHPQQPHSHPLVALSDLTKLSHHPIHRRTISEMGGLYAIAELIKTDHQIYSPETTSPCCLEVRKYSGQILTNLTCDDNKNKSLLCSFPGFLRAWVTQLRSPSEEAHQVTASVLRNLSWRADNNSKRMLRESGTVKILMESAIISKCEATLRSILSALWNLSAHCTINKAEICAVDGALNFLVELLNPQDTSERNLALVENAGGILRNISSHVAIEENYRKILRRKRTLHVLVQLLSSPSLTVVSNVCGTLWNLSARCPTDQKTLWDLGTVQILRPLVHSQHKMISMGANATLRNLLSARQHTFGLEKRERFYGINTEAYEEGDQPIDYSKKYLEQKREKIKAYGDYAETDLDQPTDYSLRYAEDDQESEDEHEPRPFFQPNEDSVKTYCTEGTPYETPRNFSTATSMSDLRVDDKDDRKVTKKEVKDKEEFYSHSRVNSLSSLASKCDPEQTEKAPGPGGNGPDLDASLEGPDLNASSHDLSPDPLDVNPSLDVGSDLDQTDKEEKNDKEPKVVTFAAEDHYDEKETPLMFSRSSSLGSLSGFEANSVDDHSSIISDFSRMTSGIISPSELPDSPTQTVPPSPRTKEFPRSFLKSYSPKKRGVFEDATAAFKEENTPIEFSAATSLSSLTIDDDPPLKVELDQDQDPEQDPIREREQEVEQKPRAGLISRRNKGIKEEKADDQVSDDDDEILAACINIGMHNNHYRENLAKLGSGNGLGTSNLIRYQTSTTLDRLETDRVVSSPKKGKADASDDSVHVYCTEDTPAEISPVGSQSNLSALSMPSILEDFEKPEEEEGEGDNAVGNDGSLTDDSSDDEKILDECIASGMSKCISPTAKAEVFMKRREFGDMDREEDEEEEEEEEEEEGNNSFDSVEEEEDDDDAILAECIESAMPKGCVLTDKATTSRQEGIKEDFDGPIDQSFKSPRSVDSLSLSEDEEEDILAECIRSGMPKASGMTKSYSPLNDEPRRLYPSINGATLSPRTFSPRHLVQLKNYDPIVSSTDETSNFETEDTPCNFSVISGISNLSLNSNFE
ncbi:adenomatous polyposis coli homolog [Microplitis mediator]|uniref:adenomatous polyposis coli homolog n=1 Tax=Microplitis mediator TaxID=375433 RepID=UPI002557B20F|nr:adenomatous polyposis coli homolog [Microplitis mediator]